jgi:hypothetical protein
MMPQVAVQRTTDANVLEENYRRIPTAPGHQLVDLLRAAIVPAALAVVASWRLMVMLAGEAAATGAPHTGLVGVLVAEAITEAEATQTATSLVSHAEATMPIAESKKFDATSPPRQAKMTASSPSLLGFTICFSPGEIETSGNHQV